jgi:LysM repeat protein
MMWKKIVHAGIVFAGLTLVSGCVMAEKYDAEKARALNFQRLLAQEEKRTGDLDSELKRVKREYADVEARNRELTAQLQAVREQMAKIQEETTALRDRALKEREASARTRKPPAKPRKQEKNLQNLGEPFAPTAEQALPTSGASPEVPSASGSALYHEVKPGDTLFRIAKLYGIDVKQLKEWNHLQGATIEVGQRLVVGQ